MFKNWGSNVDFSFDYLFDTFSLIKEKYNILTCLEYYKLKKENKLPNKFLVNRVDIDYDCTKANLMSDIFNKLDVKASFYVRLHGNYNIYGYYNYKAISSIVNSGHEIGLHCEFLSFSDVTGIEPVHLLYKDKEILERILGIKVYGCASHGNNIGRNNLHFWDSILPEDTGLLYHAYEDSDNFNLFHNSLYISDSGYTYWKTYLDGKPRNIEKDKSVQDYILEDHKQVYLLTHPIGYT